MEQVYAVCDRITVLRDGRLVGEYKISELPRVQLVSKMLGKELDDLSEIKSDSAADALENAEVVYEASGLSSAAGVRPFDFPSARARSTALRDCSAPAAANPCARSSAPTASPAARCR